MNVVCLNCGGVFDKKPWNVKRSKRHFCTKSCASSYNNRQPKRTKKMLLCSVCGEEYTRSWGKDYHVSKMHCRRCKILQKEKTRLTSLGEIKKFVKHKYQAGTKVRQDCRYWNSHLAVMPCCNCGYSLHVELCHIKPIVDFDDEATLVEINDESNILVLCRNCHWEFDNGHLIM